METLIVAVSFILEALQLFFAKTLTFFKLLFQRKIFFLIPSFVCIFFLFNSSKLDLKSKHFVVNTFYEPKIFCMILTTPNGYKDEKAQTILNVWASKCDNFKFITIIPDSLKSNKSLESFLLHPDGLHNDEYSKLTDKVLLSFRNIYKKFNGYDWYLKADDDTYIHVENLREFLKDKDPKQPVTYGYDFKLLVDHGYHSGGAGYLLSNEALNRLGSSLDKNVSFCTNTGTEDVDVARCLRRVGVYPNKSIDELGRERFNSLDLKTVYTGSVPDWLYDYAANPYRKVN